MLKDSVFLARKHADCRTCVLQGSDNLCVRLYDNCFSMCGAVFWGWVMPEDKQAWVLSQKEVKPRIRSLLLGFFILPSLNGVIVLQLVVRNIDF